MIKEKYGKITTNGLVSVVIAGDVDESGVVMTKNADGEEYFISDSDIGDYLEKFAGRRVKLTIAEVK